MSTKLVTARPRFGFFCAIAAQVMWGFFPLYYHLLKSIGALELVAHRAVWGFLATAGVMCFFWWVPRADKTPVREFLSAIQDRRTMFLILVAAMLVTVNWISFVWAATHGRSLDASLGYYICPQVHVLLGVVILGERLNSLQWIAVGLAGCGVLYISVFSVFSPWIALLMATTFGLYGLCKKQVRVAVIPGLALETGLQILPAIAYLTYLGWGQPNVLVASPWWLNILLVISGLLTVIPLALYSTALKHIPLSTAGLLQFIGPSLQFLSGVYLLGEPFTEARMIGFIFVWMGLSLFLVSNRKQT